MKLTDVFRTRTDYLNIAKVSRCKVVTTIQREGRENYRDNGADEYHPIKPLHINLPF
jgi:hypothetical protein